MNELTHDHDNQGVPPPVLVADPAVLLTSILQAATEAYAASFAHQRMVERREISDPDGDLEAIVEEVQSVVDRALKAHSDLAALTDEHLLGYCLQAEGGEEVLHAVRLIVTQISPMVAAADQAVEKATFDAIMAQAWDNEPEPDNEPDTEPDTE